MGQGTGLLGAEMLLPSDVHDVTPSGLITPPHIINGADALRLMKAQVVKLGENHIYVRREYDGDHKSAMCLNWIQEKNGPRQPDCLIGHVLASLSDGDGGTALDHVVAACNAACAFGTLAHLRIAHASDLAIRAFMTAQRRQDVGNPWGVCLAMATADYIESRAWVPDEVVAPT